MSDRYGGSAAADRLLVDNHDPAISGLKVLQETTTGTVSAVHIESPNTTATAKALSVRGGADLISVRTMADVEQFKVDQSGNVTAAGTMTSAGAALANLDLLTHPVTAAVAGTMPRGRATNASSALVSGTLYLWQIPIAGGVTTSKCTMFTNTTAKTGGTHGWYVLANSALSVVAVTADQTDAATVWGAPSTGYPLSWTAPYTVPATAYYYVGVMVAMSAGGTPTFTVSGSVAAGIDPATGISSAIILGGASSTSQTTPPALASTLTSITAAGNSGYQFYAYLE